MFQVFFSWCPARKEIVISVAILQNLCDKKLTWTQSDFFDGSAILLFLCVCPTF